MFILQKWTRHWDGFAHRWSQFKVLKSGLISFIIIISLYLSFSVANMQMNIVICLIYCTFDHIFSILYNFFSFFVHSPHQHRFEIHIEFYIHSQKQRNSFKCKYYLEKNKPKNQFNAFCQNFISNWFESIIYTILCVW